MKKYKYIWILLAIFLIPMITASQQIVQTDMNITITPSIITWNSSTNITNSTLDNVIITIVSPNNNYNFTINSSSSSISQTINFLNIKDVQCQEQLETQKYVNVSYECIDKLEKSLNIIDNYITCNISLAKYNISENFRDDFTICDKDLATTKLIRDTCVTDKTRAESQRLWYLGGGALLVGIIWMVLNKRKEGIRNPTDQFPKFG